MTYENNLSIEKEEIIIVDPIKYIKYGWNRDKSDKNDLIFTPLKNLKFKRKFILNNLPPVIDQDKLGSCTSMSVCNAILYCEMLESTKEIVAKSPLFVYYNTRGIDGNVNEDSGASIRNTIKSINKSGLCSEKKWPYNITQFTEKPTFDCYKEAKEFRKLKYERIIQNVYDIKAAIYSGYPIVFGITIYNSIKKSTVNHSGIIPLSTNDSEILGYSTFLCCGWDDNCRLFNIQTPWGEKWGKKGYGYLSYDYLTNPTLCGDFWKITFK